MAYKKKKTSFVYFALAASFLVFAGLLFFSRKVYEGAKAKAKAPTPP